LQGGLPKEARAIMTNDAQRFAGQIRSVLEGKFPKGRLLTVGNTPKVFQELGVPSLKLVMRSEKVQEILISHYMTEAIISKTADSLINPIMIFKSSTQDNALAVLLDIADQKGKPVIAALHIAVGQKSSLVNRLASIYGKDNIQRWVNQQIINNRLLYIDNKKALRLSDSTGFQLPRDVFLTTRADDAKLGRIIPSNQPQVKNNNQSKPLLTLKNKGNNHENH
jgi:hypothetical protein